MWVAVPMIWRIISATLEYVTLVSPWMPPLPCENYLCSPPLAMQWRKRQQWQSTWNCIQKSQVKKLQGKQQTTACEKTKIVKQGQEMHKQLQSKMFSYHHKWMQVPALFRHCAMWMHSHDHEERHVLLCAAWFLIFWWHGPCSLAFSWLAPTQYHARNLLKVFFTLKLKINKILESAKFLDAAGQCAHCAPYCGSKNIHDSKIPAENYHKILAHGRKRGHTAHSHNKRQQRSQMVKKRMERGSKWQEQEAHDVCKW